MPQKTIGIRVAMSKHGLKVTAVKSSPRGTKFLGKSVVLKEPFIDKKARRNEIEQAIITVSDPQ